MNRLNGFIKKLWNGLGSSPSTLNIYDYISGDLTGNGENIVLYAHNAIVYYTNIAPVYTAVEMISNSFAQITPVIKVNGEVIEDHELLKKLEAPNGDLTYTEYAKQLAAWYLITGNVFISASGEKNTLPLELEIIKPQFMTANPSTKDMYVESYLMSGLNRSNTFKREENSNGRFRFYNDTELNELWHIKTFNPNSSSLLGLSPLNAVYYEIEQYLASSKHNKSVLNNGSRTSGVLSHEGNLNDDQRSRLETQLRNKNTGSDNAGRIFFFDGDGKFTFQEMSKTMKDMDFKELKRDVVNTIYNATRIPIPLISPEHMTLSNYAESQVAFWDGAVIPLAKRLFQEQAVFLAPRIKEKNLQITFDEAEIPTLRERQNVEKERIRKASILTPNESRELDGYDGVANGDKLYQPNNLIIVGESENSIEAEKNYIDLMKKQGHTEEEIKAAWLN